jgi:hypothetical protein
MLAIVSLRRVAARGSTSNVSGVTVSLRNPTGLLDQGGDSWSSCGEGSMAAKSTSYELVLSKTSTVPSRNSTA